MFFSTLSDPLLSLFFSGPSSSPSPLQCTFLWFRTFLQFTYNVRNSTNANLTSNTTRLDLNVCIVTGSREVSQCSLPFHPPVNTSDEQTKGRTSFPPSQVSTLSEVRKFTSCTTKRNFQSKTLKTFYPSTYNRGQNGYSVGLQNFLC